MGKNGIGGTDGGGDDGDTGKIARPVFGGNSGPVAVSGSGLSYIEDHERAVAKKLIDDQFVAMTGKPFGFRVAGYYLVCKIYVRPEELAEVETADGKKVTLFRPDMSRDHDKYHSCAALVCGIGPQAFTGYDIHGHARFPAGAACRVGDWISIPRNNSFLQSYRGVAIAIIPDDMALGVIEDPEDVTPIQQAGLF